MRMHDWEDIGPHMTAFLASTGIRGWLCRRCRQETVSLEAPAPDGEGHLRLKRGSEARPVMSLSLIPLDCNEAMVERIMLS